MFASGESKLREKTKARNKFNKVTKAMANGLGIINTVCGVNKTTKRYRDVLVEQPASRGVDFQHNQRDKYRMYVKILSALM
ncbi:hypothetical protein M7I_6646 [Glarea lozoyensis 74030]|uniref:Uncharacterized protein n=1 Tax=Glarea lozoyensis (strain ATCC 74030 / MF5533) TaxID=1104152 RepID=H0EV53_GLAL7|nr:hypothetical protein M7I_6646 [Glarea lozoyensis 74030]